MGTSAPFRRSKNRWSASSVVQLRPPTFPHSSLTTSPFGPLRPLVAHLQIVLAWIGLPLLPLGNRLATCPKNKTLSPEKSILLTTNTINQRTDRHRKKRDSRCATGSADLNQHPDIQGGSPGLGFRGTSLRTRNTMPRGWRDRRIPLTFVLPVCRNGRDLIRVMRRHRTRSESPVG